MTLISLPAAITLTARSERTLWRMFADGSAAREVINGKAMFDLSKSLFHFMEESVNLFGNFSPLTRYSCFKSI